MGPASSVRSWRLITLEEDNSKQCYEADKDWKEREGTI